MSKHPQEFSERQLWFIIEGQTITVGATQSGLDGVGTIRNLDLPDTGETYDAGDDMGAVLGRDGNLRIEAPKTLKVIEHNSEVVENPSFLEDDPTGDAWILRGELV